MKWWMIYFLTVSLPHASPALPASKGVPEQDGSLSQHQGQGDVGGRGGDLALLLLPLPGELPREGPEGGGDVLRQDWRAADGVAASSLSLPQHLPHLLPDGAKGVPDVLGLGLADVGATAGAPIPPPLHPGAMVEDVPTPQLTHYVAGYFVRIVRTVGGAIQPPLGWHLLVPLLPAPEHHGLAAAAGLLGLAAAAGLDCLLGLAAAGQPCLLL